MTKEYLSLFLFFVVFGNVFSQISPPGLGKAHTADWFALGIRQDLDTLDIKGWQSLSYVGMGRKSNPDNYDPHYKPAIWVFNQEYHLEFGLYE